MVRWPTSKISDGMEKDGSDVVGHLGALEVVSMGLGYVEGHGYEVVCAVCRYLGDDRVSNRDL